MLDDDEERPRITVPVQSRVPVLRESLTRSGSVRRKVLHLHLDQAYAQLVSRVTASPGVIHAHHKTQPPPS